MVKKQDKDFTARLDLKFNYHIYMRDVSQYKKGQKVILDLAMDENRHTMIELTIKKVYKRKFVGTFIYLD